MSPVPVAIIDCSPLWLKTCHWHVFLTRRASGREAFGRLDACIPVGATIGRPSCSGGGLVGGGRVCGRARPSHPLRGSSPQGRALWLGGCLLSCRDDHWSPARCGVGAPQGIRQAAAWAKAPFTQGRLCGKGGQREANPLSHLRCQLSRRESLLVCLCSRLCVAPRPLRGGTPAKEPTPRGSAKTGRSPHGCVGNGAVVY